MPHNHQCYTLGNHCAEFHPIPSVGRNQCKFPIPCKSPFEGIKIAFIGDDHFEHLVGFMKS